MKLTIILLSYLIESLETLASSEKQQILIWSGGTERMEPYVETISSLYEDSGFHWAVEKNEAAAFLGQDLTDLILKIQQHFHKIDVYAEPREQASCAAMSNIRELAKTALPLARAKTEGLIYKDGNYWQP